MASINDFSFVELVNESGRGSVNADPSSDTAVRSFKIAWGDMPAFVSALRGGYAKVNDQLWLYAVPNKHPDWSHLYCTSVNFEPLGFPTWDGVSKTSDWDYAVVTATYTSLQFDGTAPEPKDLIEEELDIGSRIVNISGYTYKESGGSAEKVEEILTKIIPTLEYSLRLVDTPSLPGGSVALIMATIGKLNSTLFRGADIETLLYMGARARRKQSSQGFSGWTIDHRFKYQPFSWNKVMALQKSAPVLIEAVDGSGKKLYDTADFNSLIPL